MHDDLEFQNEHNDSVHWLAGETIPKRGAHTTISSDGLQNELVIGRVSVLGNLGKGGSIIKPGSTSEGDPRSGTLLSRAEGGLLDHQDVKPEVSELGPGKRIQIIGWRPGIHFRDRPVYRISWSRRMNHETLTSPLNFWTASAYGNPAILAESVSK